MSIKYFRLIANNIYDTPLYLSINYQSNRPFTFITPVLSGSISIVNSNYLNTYLLYVANLTYHYSIPLFNIGKMTKKHN